MKIIDYLENLKEDFKDDTVTRKNGTLLLAPGRVAKSKHRLFRQLPEEILNDYLIAACRNPFPEQYAEFLRYSNGASLFCVRLKSDNADSGFVVSMLEIFGLPFTPPQQRAKDMEEPYDVRIETLRRGDKISDKWLKCGVFFKKCDFHNRMDIFIDTVTQKVYSCEDRKDKINDEWNSLDECLCEIFDSLKDLPEEFIF